MKTELRRYLELAIVGGVLLPALVYAGVDTAWVRRYDGPGHRDDWATCIAVDSSDNVYVAGASAADTGNSNLDYVTIKYYPNGDTAWVRRRDFGGTDIPYGLGVDAQGNVYVTGTGNSRIATVKYSPTGQLLWSQPYGSQGSISGGYDLAIDAQGNVLVCGSVPRATDDFVTVKYRPDGETAWVRVIDGAGDTDCAFALVVGALDNVCVTGYCLGRSPGGEDYLTVSYDSVGAQLWLAAYDGYADRDLPADIAADSVGNVFVTGRSEGPSTSWDYLTIKYGSTGETLWTRRYDGPAGGDDEAKAMAVDVSGSVYVTGRSQGQGHNYWDYATVKYGSDGTNLWSAIYDGPPSGVDEAYAIAVDQLGNAYVTGGARVQQYVSGCVTIKYDPDGDTVWVATYVAPPSTPNYGTEIAVGADGSVYVAGTNDNDILTIKYVQAGGVVEAHNMPCSASSALVAEPSVFGLGTTVHFCVRKAATARVLVFDAEGRRVRTLVDGNVHAGSDAVTWDGCDDHRTRVPPGVYILVLEAGEESARVKVVMSE